MSETSSSEFYDQASLPWKIAGYCLLIPVIFLAVYGGVRLIVATFLITNTTGGSVYPLFVLPASIFLTPVLSFSVPYLFVRDASPSQIRTRMIIGGVLLAVAIIIMVTVPDLATVLWGGL